MSNVKPGSIVVAADGSAEASLAVQWAVEQAALERRTLAVVTVVQVPVPAGAMVVPGSRVGPADFMDACAAITAESVALAERHRPGVEVEGVTISGDTRDALIELSSEAHLIVLGSRGRGPVRSVLLGSIGAGVSKHAHCPVVVCRPGTELAVKRGVLVAADGTAGSLPVVEFAFRQAALRSQPLTAVHCFWDAIAGIEHAHLAYDGADGAESGRLLLAESIAGFRERYPEVHVTERVARGSVVECLTTIADEHNLVVIGRHPLDSLAAKFTGATSTSVLERAHTPVAVVPEDWDA